MRIPLLLAGLGLAGAVGATLFLHRSAQGALDRVLDERLRAAGESAALLLGPPQPGSPRLRALMNANGLDGAYLLDASLTVVEDAAGGAGRKADLLRVDPERVRQALQGRESIAPTWEIGELSVATGYFPVPGKLVLALDAGEQFVAPRKALAEARDVAILLSLVGAVALGLAAARWNRTLRRAARSEVASRMAAMAAHEIRNPLAVIRANVDMMRDRLGPDPSPRDQEAIADVLQEIERLRRLTEDFLDLGRDRPLSMGPVNLKDLLEESAQAAERTFPSVKVKREYPGSLPVLNADGGRLRQVFTNLLVNAAQAQGQGEIVLRSWAPQGRLHVQVQDFGPGVPKGLKLFDPFETRKQGGTGLGLYVAKRLVERHGGTLRLAGGPPGAVFEVTLPVEGA
ncbi:MAG TPA: ATP-binding protein [Myxococcales bacterium]|nr:ATP-binding protein [Myxococcales bacterium]